MWTNTYTVVNADSLTKLSATTFFCSILTFFMPIKGIVLVITAMFAVDWLLGLLVGVLLDEEHFKCKKFLVAIAIVCCYYLIVALSFFTGKYLDNLSEAMTIIKTITSIFVYCYAINILKNLKRFFPTTLSFIILHEMLTLSFISKFPIVKKHIKKHSKKK